MKPDICTNCRHLLIQKRTAPITIFLVKCLISGEVFNNGTSKVIECSHKE